MTFESHVKSIFWTSFVTRENKIASAPLNCISNHFCRCFEFVLKDDLFFDMFFMGNSFVPCVSVALYFQVLSCHCIMSALLFCAGKCLLVPVSFMCCSAQQCIFCTFKPQSVISQIFDCKISYLIYKDSEKMRANTHNVYSVPHV